MVYILNELIYEGESAGYRCIIYDEGIPYRKQIVDISCEDYDYICRTYGKLYYCGIFRGNRPATKRLYLNSKGYLETGDESESYYMYGGLDTVEKDILKDVKKDILEMQKDREIIKTFKAKYDEYNRLYFYNRLPSSMRIVLNRRYTKSGATFSWYERAPYRNKISISTKYMKNQPEEIDDTLIHEMIHAYMYELGYLKENHGSRFTREMNRINSMGRNITKYIEKPFSYSEYKFLLQCRSCGSYSKGKRRLRYALQDYTCKICNGSFVYKHKEPFYVAYKCNSCNELFFGDSEEDIKEEQYCPYCNTKLKEI